MKAFLQYAAMVGIPFIIVLIFVRVGEKIMSAPASIGGNWTLEPSLETGEAGFECPAFVFEGELVMTISQSGVYLEVTFNDRDNTTLSGMLTDLSISAQKSTPFVSFILEAAVDRQPEPDSLDGILMLSSCEEPFSFLGSRWPDINQTSEGH